MSLYATTQSIFTPQGKTWAIELLYRQNMNVLDGDGNPDPLLQERADDETYELLRERMDMAFHDKRGYVCFSTPLLCRNISDAVNKKRTVIEVTPEILADKRGMEKVMYLKRMGYTLAINNLLYCDEHRELFNFMDIIRFPIESDRNAVELTVEKAKELGKTTIADKVNDEEQLEFAVSAGVDLVSGFYFARPVLETKKSGGPMIKTFLQLIAMLYGKEPDIEQVAAVISTDPVLTIRLLRLINKLCEDKGNTVSTVHQALVMLGIEKLKEWIYAVGLQRLNRDAPAELLRMALFRASFCENLGRVVAGVGSRTKELYLMGLISIITGTRGKQLAAALEQLPVSPEIKEGLQGGGSVFSNIYELAYYYERGDWDRVDYYVAKCHIEKDALNMVYLNTVRFLDQFHELYAN